MTNFALVLVSIAVTVVSWGLYGPLIRTGTAEMMGDHIRPFICVGIAYFFVGVVAPLAVLVTRGEKGSWTMGGLLWSSIAGIATAIGALGVVLAFSQSHNPASQWYVMPLVFGGAPVVNTILTTYMNRSFKQVGPLFLAGLILVVAGASTVLVFKPQPVKAAAAPSTEAATPAASETAPQSPDAHETDAAHGGGMLEVLMFVGLTILCWGAYGPLLHKGQMLMQGSRLRPLMCVGVAYFVVAVVVALTKSSGGVWTPSGAIWSLAGGTAGAIGALGVIWAFNYGGKPIYVMPLIFGGAPVVNTLTSILTTQVESISPAFYAGLIVLVAGAVTVLVFAPKGHPPAKPA